MDGLFEFFFPDGLNSSQNLYGFNLSDDVILQSVHDTSVFFGIDDTLMVDEGWTTGVMTNMGWTMDDDILIYNREQLAEMGISDKEGLDMVMTHEGAHRMLQNMHCHTGFNSHQEELCCDFMVGVRAGLNDMNERKMTSALEGTLENDTHPDGMSRVESIENGVVFAHEFEETYHRAPTFNECLEHFERTDVCISANVDGGENDTSTHLFIDDKVWHNKKAGENQFNADYYNEKAKEAARNGYDKDAVEFASKAKSYAKAADNQRKLASMCSK